MDSPDDDRQHPAAVGQGGFRFGYLYPADRGWLARAEPEAILEPGLPIVDAHHHLWDVKGRSNPYLNGGSDRYLLDEYGEDIAVGHRVVASVYLECRSAWRQDGPPPLRPVGEVQFAAGMAALSESGHYGPARVACAIVGHADLALGPAVAEVLDAGLAVSGGRLRGIRYSGAWDPDPLIRGGAAGPAAYRQPAVRRGFECLARRGLVFDAHVFFPQLDDAAHLAGQFPDTQIVIGHTGGLLGYGRHAGRADEVYARWKQGMQGLARHPNVTVKLGGLTNRLAAFDFRRMPRPPGSVQLAEWWRPYIETCIELFGAGRCMFTSNFPVEKMGVGYAALWNAYKRIVASASAAEKQALFSGTAARVYGLQADVDTVLQTG